MKRANFHGAALIAATLSLSGLLSGCGSFWDTLGDQFSTLKTVNLRGMRVSLAGTEEEMQVDPALAATPLLLPRPYRNPDWPQPGGYPANALYHLEAPGPLRR